MNPVDSFRMDGKVAVVTGASGGLGAGFANALSAAGATVVLAARRLAETSKVAEEIERKGGTTLVVRADVSSDSDCRSVAQRAVETFGRIDVLVNNAGTANTIPATRESSDEFRRVIDVNLLGTYWMSQAAIGVMPPGSSIVNVASVLGLVASPYPQAAYSASKAGVLGLTRDLAQQWSRRKGVRVNALLPGFFQTAMTEGATDLEDRLEQLTILGRSGRQEEIDSALLFLASPASSYVTGSSLIVDGGLTSL